MRRSGFGNVAADVRFLAGGLARVWNSGDVRWFLDAGNGVGSAGFRGKRSFDAEGSFWSSGSGGVRWCHREECRREMLGWKEQRKL